MDTVLDPHAKVSKPETSSPRKQAKGVDFDVSSTGEVATSQYTFRKDVLFKTLVRVMRRTYIKAFSKYLSDHGLDPSRPHERDDDVVFDFLQTFSNGATDEKLAAEGVDKASILNYLGLMVVMKS